MDQLAIYLIIYLLIGVAVAVAMASVPIQEPRGSNQLDETTKKHMLDAYCFIGLAWPVSVLAFLYGAGGHLMEKHWQQGNKTKPHVETRPV